MPAARPPLRLTLVGAFELTHDGAPVPLLPSAQRLVAFVALHEHGVDRAAARSALWGDLGEQRANSCLRSTLWRTPDPGGHPVIEATHSRLRLHPGIEVDLRQSVEWAFSVLDGRDGDLATPDLGYRLRRFGGDVLCDWDDAWVRAERERFRQLRLHTLEAVCGRLADCGRYALAIEAGLAAVECAPLRESAHRLVIRAHLMEGNVAEALRQHRRCCELLAHQLGTSPSPAMDRLFQGPTGRGAPVSSPAYVPTAGHRTRGRPVSRVPS